MPSLRIVFISRFGIELGLHFPYTQMASEGELPIRESGVAGGKDLEGKEFSALLLLGGHTAERTWLYGNYRKRNLIVPAHDLGIEVQLTTETSLPAEYLHNLADSRNCNDEKQHSTY